jgi:hypothetical protein
MGGTMSECVYYSQTIVESMTTMNKYIDLGWLVKADVLHTMVMIDVTNILKYCGG